MLKAQHRRATKLILKPRNPLGRHPLMGKGGAHEPQDKHAKRARLKQRLHDLLREME